MSPEISVLLPVYNGAQYLEAAVDSALAQSYTDFELLIVDDCSTDESPAIIEKLKVRDERIKVFTNETNQGLFANYNRCLEKAQGRYIKPFAQDDLFRPDAFEKMRNALETDKSIALVSCARNIIDSSADVVETKSVFDAERKVKGHDVILYNLILLSNWIGEPSTVMFRKEFAGTGFDTRFFHYGDVDMWFNVLLNGDFYFLHEPLASFRRHEGSATDKNLSGLLFALDAVLMGKKYKDIITGLGESEEHYLFRVAETAALHVDHLVRTQGLTAQECMIAAAKGARLGVAKDKAKTASQMMSAFVELSFVMARGLTNALAKLSAAEYKARADQDYLNLQMENIRSSASWRITAPLRRLMGKVKT